MRHDPSLKDLLKLESKQVFEVRSKPISNVFQGKKVFWLSLFVPVIC